MTEPVKQVLVSLTGALKGALRLQSAYVSANIVRPEVSSVSRNAVGVAGDSGKTNSQ